MHIKTPPLFCLTHTYLHTHTPCTFMDPLSDSPCSYRLTELLDKHKHTDAPLHTRTIADNLNHEETHPVKAWINIYHWYTVTVWHQCDIRFPLFLASTSAYLLLSNASMWIIWDFCGTKCNSITSGWKKNTQNGMKKWDQGWFGFRFV